MANPTGTLNADEDHSTRKITNLVHPPVADHDAATKKYVDDNIVTGSVSDIAFGASWNGITNVAPSKNAVYDWAHAIDSDDDGKVNVLDSVAGLVKTDAGGVVSNAVAKSDYWDTSDFTASGTGHAHGLVPDPGATVGATRFLREDGTWIGVTGTGTVTTTGTPTTGNLTKFSSGTSITNADLTGDVTTSGGVATTIAPNAVTLAKMATMATDSILGRATTGTGNVESLSALPFAFTGDVTRPADSNITTIAANAVSLGQMATVATDSILGRATAATGNVEVLTALPFAFTGDVTRASDSNTQTIANSAVTYAKMQNVSANSKLLGSGATGSGAPPGEIALGTGLSMSGSTLNATGGGGGTIASTTDILKGDGSGNAVALGSATSGKVLKSNGTVFVASTETYAAPGTSGNVLTSDGTNWTSATPGGAGGLPQQVLILAADDVFTDTANHTVTGLLANQTNGKVYKVEALLLGNSSTTAGAHFWIAGTGTGAGAMIATPGIDAATSSVNYPALSNQPGDARWLTASTESMAQLIYIFKATATTTGGILVRCNKITSGTLTIRAGSILIVTTLN